MCKLFIATGAFTREQVMDMLRATNASFAKSQRDGFGFVAYGSKKSVAHGKYLDPSEYHGYGKKLPQWVRSSRIEVGEIPEITTALVVHGRTSTNSVLMHNVHPFHNKGVFLAHNGVLGWKGEGPAPTAKHGCDTEQFFNWLQDQGDIGQDVAWDATHDHWTGYGVFGIINSKTGHLTVAKCGSGNLKWVGNDTDNFFSTDGVDLLRITRSANFRFSKTADMQPKTRVVFKLGARGSKVQLVTSWKGFGVRVIDDSWRKSMGGSHYSRSSHYNERWDGYGVAKTNERPTVAVKPTANDFNGVSVPRDRQCEMFPDWEPTVAELNKEIEQ